jgi:hypothetical protein
VTRDQAQADLERALKHCFPDRWEEILSALALEPATVYEAVETTRIVPVTRRRAGNAPKFTPAGASLVSGPGQKKT